MTTNPLITQAAKDRHVRDNARTCTCCGSNISTYNANKSVVAVRPEASNWDWWAACDNANCVNAYGEGYFQERPEWIKS